MSNKRSLDQSSQSEPKNVQLKPTIKAVQSSDNQSKKVKFAASSSSSNERTYHHNPLSSTFEPIDQSSDLNFDELNQVGKIKKGRVKTEGYDSDSSTENNQVRTTKKSTGNNHQDDDDMFGDEDQDEPNCNSKFEKVDAGLTIKKGAEVKDYLDLGDIEGQEFGNEDQIEGDQEEDEDGNLINPKNQQRSHDGEDGHGVIGDDYSDEEEDYVPGDEFANADDAPRARRKSKKGMGFLLSKFNMAEELQEGRMAADGSYVPSAKDPEAVHDNWLEGVNTKKTIKQAREAKRKRDEQLRNQVEKDQTLSVLRSRKECYAELLELLPAGDGRSVSQIICQLGNIKRALQTNESKKKKLIQKKSVIDDLVPDSIIPDDDNNHDRNHPNRQTSTDQNQNPPSSNKAKEEMKLDKLITEITDLASTLMGTHGDLDIYDLTHGSIVGVLKSEGLVARDWKAPSNQYVETLFQSNPNNHKLTPHPAQKNNSSQKTLISRPTNATAQPNNQPSIYYRFIPSDPNNQTVDPNQIFGPFDHATMNAWAQQGFFGTNFDRILIKLDHSIGGQAPWGAWHQIINQ